MNPGPRQSVQRRTRLGLPLLVIGIVLMLWAWGSWLYRASIPVEKNAEIADEFAPLSTDPALAARLSPLVLLIGMLLVLLVLFGSHALIRAARRHRAITDRKRITTPADDVWAMHKLRNRDDEP